MHQQGHVGLNLLFFVPVGYWLAASGELLLMAVAMAGVVSMAPFPDIDIHMNIKHRGITHSIWFAILTGCVYGGILVYSGVGDLPFPETAGIGFLSALLGVFGHILGDMITPMGVAPLEPVSSYYVGLGWFSSGDKRINRLFMQAGVYALAAAITLGTVDISTFTDPIFRILS